MIFDLGVYLAVLGVVIAAFNLLGMPRKGDKNSISFWMLTERTLQRRGETEDHKALAAISKNKTEERSK